MSTSDSTSPATVQTLPIVAVQATFPAVINEVYSGVIPFEDIWISCYDHSSSDRETTSESLHAKLRVVLDEVDREKVNLETREGDVRMSETEHDDKAVRFSNVYNVSSRSMHIPPTKILVPVHVYADPERANPQKPHRITAFAVAPDKSQFATGFLDGSIFLYPIIPLPSKNALDTKYLTPDMYAPPQSTYVARRQALVSASSMASGTTAPLRAHKSTVTSLRFFPSSRVLLSSSADFALQIYPADPISAASLPLTTVPAPTSPRVPSVRTLIGHSRTVTSTAIIGRGRSILSASADGTIRTWNVSRGEEDALIHTASGVAVGVNQIALKLKSPPSTADSAASGDGVLYAALQDGSFELFDLSENQELVRSFRSDRSPSGTLTALAVDSDTGEPTYFATGTAKGIITVYDASCSTIACFKRSDASIEDMAFLILPSESETVKKLGLVIATGDGLPWIACLNIPSSPTEAMTEKISVYAELAGGDVDAVRFVSVARANGSIRAEVWTAADDGVVRRYIL